MFINFRKVFEYLFASFDIAGDTKLLEKLEHDWVRFLMLIKRHWIYSIIHSWKVLFILKIALLNMYLLLFSEKWYDIISIFIAGFLAINVWYWLIIVIHYIYEFYKIQWNKPYFSDVYSVLEKSKESDTIFTNFFNQTIFILFLLLWLTIFTFIIGITALIQWWATTFWVGILNAFLLIIQVGLFYSFLNSMINQEMDFKVVIPWKVMFFNQIWVLWDSQNLNANKIKTINTQYPGILWSFFNYWDIIIFTEWDQENKGQMKMDYIGSPQNTVKEIEKIMDI